MRLPIGDRLRDQVCLVTGAASGLGKAIALRFAKEGARVAMDVTSEEQVNRGVAEIASKWGGVDVLVSNAGIQIVIRWRIFRSPTGRRCSRSISTARFSPRAPACRT